MGAGMICGVAGFVAFRTLRLWGFQLQNFESNAALGFFWFYKVGELQ